MRRLVRPYTGRRIQPEGTLRNGALNEARKTNGSVQRLVKEVPGGGFLRAFHYWGAQGVILVLLLHLLRVFITGVYKPPRLFTWYFGLALLGTALLGSYFSGTVLKWDQEAFEALAHYRGGEGAPRSDNEGHGGETQIH